MVKVTVCIGSSCHLKGSRQVVEKFQQLMRQNELDGKVELGGTFCMGNCVNGVNVMVDETQFSVIPDTAEKFFDEEIMSRVK